MDEVKKEPESKDLTANPERIPATDDTTLVGSDTPCLRMVSPEMLAGGPACQALAARLFRACDKHEGVGLAAPQLGIPTAMAVVSIPAVHVRFCMVNPTIKKLFGPERVAVEGCLSLPGVRAMKLRREQVEVIFQDERGKFHRVVTGGLLSRVIQHEVAHLRGLLITDGTVKAQPLRDTHEQEPAAHTDGADGRERPQQREVGQEDVAPGLSQPDKAVGA